MVRWTPEQERAITARNCNLLVAAAAGSGKTAVLVERIIQLIIKDRVDIDRLLIVTFTQAAAGEMRERISAAILAALEQPGAPADHLRRQLNLLSRATISTIHAFCTEVVRQYFQLIEIDPNFRIGDATETAILKLEALQEVLEAEYAQGNEDFLTLVEMFCGNRSDDGLQDLILQCYEFIQSKPQPQEWLAAQIAAFAMDMAQFRQSPWVELFTRKLQVELEGAAALFREAQRLCYVPGGPAAYAPALADDLQLVADLQQALRRDWDCLRKKCVALDFMTLARVGKDVDERLKAEVKNLRDEGKKILKAIQSGVLAKDPAAYLADLNALHPYMVYLGKLVNDFAARYQAQKQEKGIVDFNDLEHYTLAILAHAEVAAEFRRKFAYIFVDEYQDSNLVQETILNLIRQERNLFLVGDVKQSIYRFRLADPSLFIAKYETYTNDLHARDCRIDLSKNFRSRAEIINGVNFLFKHIMTREFGEIDYDERAYLYQGAVTEPIADPAIELFLVEKGVDGADLEDEIAELSDIEVEARLVATRIKELLGQEIYDGKRQCYRQVNYRDIVILLRTTKHWAQIFAETLLAAEIPAYADVNAGYFETLEVSIFLNLLRLIDNKRQDIPLLSVMRSPIGQFTVDELIRIRVNSEAPTFFEAVEAYLAANQDTLAQKLQAFIDRLHRWKEEARFLPLAELIWQLLTETGYYYYVGAMPGGRQRQANLRVLFDRARQFQQTSIKGLFNFLKFIEKLQTSQGDLGTAKILGENDNVVRIMSIHKSKGLEFPVVIVAGLGKQFNLSDTNAQVLFHKDLGIGPYYTDVACRRRTDTIARMMLQYKIRLESLSEEMRILYVACTRPKDKLILVGSVRDLPRAVQQWARTINPFNLAKGKNYLDWLGPVVLRHPAGECLRVLGGLNWTAADLLDDASQWRVSIVDRTHLQNAAREETARQQELEAMLRNGRSTPPSAVRQLIMDRLNWEYAHQDAMRIPSKLSVTQVKQLKLRNLANLGINPPPLTDLSPAHVSQGFTRAEVGTITHFVMQHLDLRDVGEQGAIDAQIARLVERELLRPEEAAVVDSRKILNFFRSPLGQRVLRADKVYREVPFNLACPACEILGHLTDCDDALLLQGTIDLYFEEDNDLVLVDYKTDLVTPQNKQSIITKYRVQLELYRLALERILGKHVKESYLYLLAIDEGVRL